MDLKKELARDFVALGGIPFFILVLIRVWILDQPKYFSQFLISGILIFGLFFVFRKKFNLSSGLALIVYIFTAIHYADLIYWTFVGIVYLFLLGSLVYLKKNKKEIIYGTVLGGVCIFLGNWIGSLIF
jgi:hypothetical protein